MSTLSMEYDSGKIHVTTEADRQLERVMISINSEYGDHTTIVLYRHDVEMLSRQLGLAAIAATKGE